MPLLVKRNIQGSDYKIGQILDDDTNFFNLRSLLDLGWVVKVTEREVERMHGSVQPTQGVEESPRMPVAPQETVQPARAIETPIQPTKQAGQPRHAREAVTTKGSTKSVKPTEGA
jgi:hypothetical protein